MINAVQAARFFHLFADEGMVNMDMARQFTFFSEEWDFSKNKYLICKTFLRNINVTNDKRYQ